jgi:SWI/SNF-related matrix-associated actin-dependent regulator of chromatin subfamily A-like protein 1
MNICSVVYKKEWPVLVICPSSVRLHWQEQILQWLPDTISPNDVTVITKGGIGSITSNLKFVIISYGLICKCVRVLAKKEFKFVICDEAHYLKNPKAQRTASIIPFIQNAKRAILISGTPALSRPYELFTQLHSLSKDVWRDERAFHERYCNYEKSTNFIIITILKGTATRGAIARTSQSCTRS